MSVARQKFGEPKDIARKTVFPVMTDMIMDFVRQAPFAVLGTANAEGDCDASPKGGQPGFVKVLDEKRLLVPDIAGNKLFHSYDNVESNSKAGLIFMMVACATCGVTMAATLISLATNNPIRGDVAMTGEVTLRGHVLPVGGIREKALAALRCGITNVIVPKSCMAEVGEIPKELRRKITFIPVEEMEQVLEAALEKPDAERKPEPPRPRRRRRSSNPVASAKSRS